MSIPATHTAGDALSFTASGDATSRAVLRHVSTGDIYRVDGVEEGAVIRFTFPGIQTAEAAPGVYAVSVITESGGRATRNLGTLRMLSPADRPARQTHARKMVNALQAHLEGRISDDAGRGLESYTIGGVPISKIPIEQARLLLEKYRVDLKREEEDMRRELGLRDRRIVKTYFNR
jgi:hypothetical protein